MKYHPFEYSFKRYLQSKKSLDDRSLNQGVWQTMKAHLPGSTKERPLHVLEVGAGIGTMLERMLGWDLLQYAEYTGIDWQAENITSARERLPVWAKQRGFRVSAGQDGAWMLERSESCVQARFQQAEMFAFSQEEKGRRSWDLLVAHSFLDLVDLPAALPALFSLLETGGLFYFTLNFDRLTLLEPPLDPALDAQIEELYHRSMDERRYEQLPAGHSRTGRRLFHRLVGAGAQLLAAGSSDWVVFPGSNGYPQDESYFLHCILEMIRSTLSGNPELDQELFEAWINRRHEQVEGCELVYIAHQLDFTGKKAA